MSEPSSAPPAELLAPQAPPAGDPLQAFLSGKRKGERHPCHLPATLEGVLAPVAATLLDISESGGLLHVDEAAFVEAEEHGGTRAYLELLSLHAKGGLTMALPGGLTVRCEMVRWTAGEAGQGSSRIGMRFERCLSAEELTAVRQGQAVGSVAGARGEPEPAPEPRRLPFTPRRGASLQVLVFRALMPEAGPLVAGRALGADQRELAVRLDGHRTLMQVAGVLAGHRLLVTLQEVGLPLWESIADVAWIAPVEGTGSVDVGLALESPMPKAARKRLR